MDFEQEAHITPPNATDIVAEAQRRITTRSTPSNQPAPRQAQDLGLWLTRHWLALFNLLIAVYLGGAFLAPLLARNGWRTPADLLYRFYGASCHQYPFRSLFLFGAHAAYPLSGELNFTELGQSKAFIGNPTMGYKVALCQRDIAIYGAALLLGLLYVGLRRYPLPTVPLWAYFLFGVLPMFLDGGIQWLSYVIWFIAPDRLPHPFETIPLLRYLTGALFGGGGIAVAYPHMNAYFDATYHQLIRQRNFITQEEA